MRKLLLLAAMLPLLSACSTQQLMPTTTVLQEGTEVCVPPDTSDRQIARNALIQGLAKKGMKVRNVPDMGTAFKTCTNVVSCMSISRWDLANFTSDIKLEYFHDGKKEAGAHYHASNGLNFSKYINTQEKIWDMLNKMFPNTREIPVKEKYKNQATNF